MIGVRRKILLGRIDDCCASDLQPAQRAIPPADDERAVGGVPERQRPSVNLAIVAGDGAPKGMNEHVCAISPKRPRSSVHAGSDAGKAGPDRVIIPNQTLPKV